MIHWDVLRQSARMRSYGKNPALSPFFVRRTNASNESAFGYDPDVKTRAGVDAQATGGRRGGVLRTWASRFHTSAGFAGGRPASLMFVCVW